MEFLTPMLEGRCRRCGWRATVCRSDLAAARASLATVMANHLRWNHDVWREQSELSAEVELRAATGRARADWAA